MQVECYHARSQNHHLAVVRRICIVSFFCGHARGEWCKHQWRSRSSNCKDTVDENSCFVTTMKCHHNVKQSLNAHLATHTIVSQPALGTSRTLINFSQTGILLHLSDFSHSSSHVCKAFNLLPISTSLASWNAYDICIQPISSIDLHSQKTVLRPLTDL
jgi:hypothetical protein